jgi:hypothetical protein
LTAISEFGGKYTYTFEPPAPPTGAPAIVTPEHKNTNTDRFEQKPLGAPKRP